METILLEKDIKVLYITAESFPNGILASHQALHNIIPFSKERKYFGVSRPENGSIIYKAAAEIMEIGEAEKYQLNTLIIKKGNYSSYSVKGYREDPIKIQDAFQKLISNPKIDPQGYCIEWYINNETVECMVRLK